MENYAYAIVCALLPTRRYDHKAYCTRQKLIGTAVARWCFKQEGLTEKPSIVSVIEIQAHRT